MTDDEMSRFGGTNVTDGPGGLDRHRFSLQKRLGPRVIAQVQVVALAQVEDQMSRRSAAQRESS